jgi:RNA polymerase sigma-70 factor (ECF subfamily)
MRRVYLKYKDYLLTLAKGLLGDPAAAEDVVHDVFVRFAETAATFRLTGSLKGYLGTCVANLARDRIRLRVRRAQGSGRVEPIKGRATDPAEDAAAGEELTRLRAALSEIPYEQREAVLLHVKAGMRFKDIAKVQGVSLSTTHGRYRYGLDRLRSLLNGEVRE